VTYNTAKNQYNRVRTPGGRLTIHYKKKKANPQRCGDCGNPLLGIRPMRAAELRRVSWKKRSVKRAYGGSRCATCVRQRILRAFLIEEQNIVKKVIKQSLKNKRKKEQLAKEGKLVSRKDRMAKKGKTEKSKDKSEKTKKDKSDKAKQDKTEKPKKDHGGKSKTEKSETPKKTAAEKPKKAQSEKPKKDQGEKPKKDQSEKPKKDQGEKPKKDQGEKPKKDQAEKPKKDQAEKPKKDQAEKPKKTDKSFSTLLNQENEPEFFARQGSSSFH
jgi:large subunit ribosomal protein L34e